MASKAAVSKNERRRKIAERYRERRQELKEIVRDTRRAMEERQEAVRMLNKMPRDASAVRVRNRCFLTGRPRGYYRKFGLSRIALRDCALNGELPGVIKSSW